MTAGEQGGDQIINNMRLSNNALRNLLPKVPPRRGKTVQEGEILGFRR